MLAGRGVEDGGESEVRIEDSEEEIKEFETEEEEKRRTLIIWPYELVHKHSVWQTGILLP